MFSARLSHGQQKDKATCPFGACGRRSGVWGGCFLHYRLQNWVQHIWPDCWFMSWMCVAEEPQPSPIGSEERYKWPFFSSRNPNFYYCYYFITVISPSVIFLYMRRCGLSMEEIAFGHLDRERRKCFPWLRATLCSLHASRCVNCVGLWAPYQTWAPTAQLLLRGKAVISPRGQQCN